MIKKPYIRFQKSRNGKYLQAVLVIPKDDGTKKTAYFSNTHSNVKNYIDNKSNQLYLVFKPMFDKESRAYKTWQKVNKINNIEKADNNNNLIPK